MMTIPTASTQKLTPLLFLERSAAVYPHRAACVYNGAVTTYALFYERVRRQAAALRSVGVGPGDRVAFLLPNLPSMLEANFGPMGIGAVLVALNIRLSAREIAYILNHSGAKVLVFDSELADTVRQLRDDCPGVETYVQVRDTAPLATDIPGPEYEQWLASVDPLPELPGPATENDTLTINYTSGTTGMPKGVEYTPRGAYINALGEAMEMGMNWRSIYLWTLPMFHANGWCFPWAVTAVGGAHVCLRRVDPAEVYRLIREESVTHLCAAPTVLTGLYAAPEAATADLSGLTIMTAGAPPAPQVIRTIEGMGAEIIHVYGLTETYGPCTVAAGQPEWDAMDSDNLARVKARQGVPFVVYGTGLRVVDEDMDDVPRDAETMGEVVMQGDAVMKGYYNDRRRHRRGFPRRLVPFRRPRRVASRRLHRVAGPFQGHHHLRGREHLQPGGRKGHHGTPGRSGSVRGWRARSAVGRGSQGIRRAPGRRGTHGRRDHRLHPGPHRPLQGAQERGVRRPAQNRHRQDPEVHPARQGMAGPGAPHPGFAGVTRRCRSVNENKEDRYGVRTLPRVSPAHRR